MSINDDLKQTKKKPKINLYQSLVDIEERIDEYRDKLDKVGVWISFIKKTEIVHWSHF